MRKFLAKGKEKLLQYGQERYNNVFLKIGLSMSCLFCDIVQGTIPAEIVFDNEQIIAFRDIHPQAPYHVLIIPKQHIATINDTLDGDNILLGKMIIQAKKIAQADGFSEDGYRLVFNINPNGGQEIYHIHLHLLGGRQMAWPPG